MLRRHAGYWRFDKNIFKTVLLIKPALTQLARDEHDVQIMFVCI